MIENKIRWMENKMGWIENKMGLIRCNEMNRIVR